MKVYISGPITGIDDHKKIFLRTEEHLTDQGYEVLNPTRLPHNHDKKYSSYMKEDVKALLECDAIYMMSGWINSKGAKFEHETAEMCGIERLYGAHI